MVTVKYGANGDEIWVKHSNPGDFAGGMILDNEGNVYVTGNNSISGHFVTTKYDPNGKQLWLVPTSGARMDNLFPLGIVLDASRNVYIAGYFWKGDGSVDYFAVKYSQTIIKHQANGVFAFQFPAAADQTNRIQASTDLKTWLDVSTGLTDATGIFKFQDTNGVDFHYRFYRSLALP